MPRCIQVCRFPVDRLESDGLGVRPDRPTLGPLSHPGVKSPNTYPGVVQVAGSGKGGQIFRESCAFFPLRVPRTGLVAPHLGFPSSRLPKFWYYSLTIGCPESHGSPRGSEVY